VSKATRVTAQALCNHRSKNRNLKQVSFKPGPEDCYRRCGSDKIRQTDGKSDPSPIPWRCRYIQIEIITAARTV